MIMTKECRLDSKQSREKNTLAERVRDSGSRSRRCGVGSDGVVRVARSEKSVARLLTVGVEPIHSVHLALTQ